MSKRSEITVDDVVAARVVELEEDAAEIA